jgi:hypothetical protein
MHCAHESFARTSLFPHSPGRQSFACCLIKMSVSCEASNLGDNWGTSLDSRWFGVASSFRNTLKELAHGYSRITQRQLPDRISLRGTQILAFTSNDKRSNRESRPSPSDTCLDAYEFNTPVTSVSILRRPFRMWILEAPLSDTHQREIGQNPGSLPGFFHLHSRLLPTAAASAITMPMNTFHGD